MSNASDWSVGSPAAAIASPNPRLTMATSLPPQQALSRANCSDMLPRTPPI